MAETTSEWSEVVVTSLGLRLDAKVKAGLTGFRVAKVTVGDGFLDEGDNPLSLTDLKHEIPSHQSGTEGDTTTADITIIRAIDTGTAAVKVRIQNGNESFYLREIGIWAVDPDLGLILYAYTNAGDNARMLEAYNGRTHIIRKLTIPFLLSNTTDITANCTFVAEVSEEMFEAYKTEVNTRFGTVIPVSEKGTAGGVAELDENGFVPSSQLPSYVDDILEYDGISAFPVTGESGKIYVDRVTNRQYRWGGTQYTEVSKSLALGETESTAYRGDRGKIAYNHSQAAHAPANAEPHKAPTSSEVVSAIRNQSPVFNAPTASTPVNAENSSRIATTEYVRNVLNSEYGEVYVTDQLDVLTASGTTEITSYSADTRISQVLSTVTTTWGTATHGADHGEEYYSSYYDNEGMDLYIKLYVLSGVLYWDEYYGTPPASDGIYLGKAHEWGHRGDEYFGIDYENPSPAGGTPMSLHDAVVYLLQRINH